MADPKRKFLVIDRVLRDAHATLSVWYWEGQRFCWGLEDQPRAPGVKVPGETRIPAGTYRLELRAEGGMHEHYKKRFPFHRGMLWLRDVPFFEFIYLHPLNKDTETEGCLGPGLRPGPLDAERLTIESSVPAYERLYRRIIEAMEMGFEVYVVVRDLDQGTDGF